MPVTRTCRRYRMLAGADDGDPAQGEPSTMTKNATPDDHSKKSFWVTAETQTDSTDLALVGGVLFEGRELAVGERFATQGEQPGGRRRRVRAGWKAGAGLRDDRRKCSPRRTTEAACSWKTKTSW